MLPALRFVIVGTAICAAAPAAAQGVVMTPVPVPARVVDNVIHSVSDLERSFAFYRDVIGLPVIGAPGEAIADPRLQRLTDTAGASVRSARLALPNTPAGLLLTEFSGIDRQPRRPRPTDPGASTLVLTVRDPASMIVAARAFDATPPVVSPDGRVVLMRDPDGFWVEVVRAGPEAPGDAAANVVGVRLAFTLADSAPVAEFYRDVLGFAVSRAGEGDRPWIVQPPPLGAAGTGELSRAVQIARIAGSPLEWELVTFEGVGQVAYAGRPQDPGTPAVSLVVPDVDVAARTARERALPIVTAGGTPVRNETGGAVLVRDPGGMLLELIERD